MNKINSINKRDLLYNEILPYRKYNFKIEKDFNENFPKIESKYFWSNNNQNESKLTNNNNVLTIHKSENKNQNNKKNITLSKVKNIIKNKFFLNIKNIEIEEKKDSNKYQTLTDININKILEKKKKNNLILNAFKEKNNDRNMDNNFTNIGINNKLSKTALNFHPQKNNKVIYSYKTKDKEINKYNNNKEKQHKAFYSRNASNNFRTIISSNNNKTIDYKMRHNISNKNNNSIKYKTNNQNKFKINNIVFQSLSNQIFRKIELSNQMNKKISDVNVQNLLMKEIEEIEKIKKSKYQITETKNIIFNNKSIKDKLLNINSDNYENNNNNNINKKNQNKKKLENNTEKKEIISKLKSIDLSTDIQMFDDNFEPNEELIKLYREYKKKLLNDKDVILELGQYFISIFAPKNKKKRNVAKKKFQDKIIMTDMEELNENEKEKEKEKEKSIYNEEEKNIIQDIIYELSNDLNENLDLYKREPNRNKKENSLRINNVTLAQLFEKLNKMQNIKKRNTIKLFPNKTEENNNIINNNENKMNISFNEINNNTDEDNEENKKLLNDILFNIIGDKKTDNKEKKLNINNNNKLNNTKEGNENLHYDEIKSSNNTKILNKEKTKIKNSIINKKKNESNLSRSKKKETRRIDIIKNKEKKEEKNFDNKSQNRDSILHPLQPYNYLDLNNNENEYNINTERYKKIDLNNNIEIINEGSLLNKELDEDNISSNFEDDNDDNNINKNKKEKKSNMANKSKNKEKEKKANKKEVKFYENNNNILNDLNSEYFLLSNNDSFNISPKKKKRFHFSSMNDYEENDDNSDKNKKYRKFSSKKGSIIESLSKIRKRQFQKTRRDKTKTKRLLNIKNEEDINKEQEEIPVDIKEEMLNRKLRNFFGKINMLKNSSSKDYDEQLKMFIDNEIDKLNDWETKEQEIRINNFFSDLKLMKKRFKIGSEIKYASPSAFSSTFTNFPKFK